MQKFEPTSYTLSTEDKLNYDALAFPVFDSLTLDEKSDCMFFLWDLFNTVPFDASSIPIGSRNIPKCTVFDLMIRYHLMECFFEVDVLSAANACNVVSLTEFLHQLLSHLLSKTEAFMEKDAACLSHLICLSWWEDSFSTPIAYCHLSRALHFRFIHSVPQVGSLFLSQLARFPEHANVFATNILRVCSELEQRPASHEDISKELFDTKHAEDAASRMLGIHSSVVLRHLTTLYHACCTTLEPTNARPKAVDKDVDLSSTVSNLTDLLVRCRLIDSLRQRPDLPISCSSTVRRRLSVARDFYLARACRLLAANLLPHESSISRRAKLVHAIGPRHLAVSLLSTSPSSASPSLPSTHETGGFDPHVKLICWSIEHNLHVSNFAKWFVDFSELKDVNLADCVLTRLLKHSTSLATDVSFCFALIQRMDRVRKAQLPDHNYITLLRRVLSHMSTDAKGKLLGLVHSSANASGATPLHTSGDLFTYRLRSLFNRLVLTEEGTRTQQGKCTEPSTVSVGSWSSEFILDCELLLISSPVHFLAELVSLPVTRHCAASQPAVLQLLTQLSYCLSVPICGSRTAMANAVTEVANTAVCDKTVLEMLLLPNKNSPSLFHDSSVSVPLDQAGVHNEDFVCLSETQSYSEEDTSLTDKMAYNAFSKHPLVVTIAHLLLLAPTIVPSILASVIQHLAPVSSAPRSSTPLSDHFIVILIGAAVVSTPQIKDPPLVDLIMCQLIHMFELLFATHTSHEVEFSPYELDAFLVSLFDHLFSEHSASILPRSLESLRKMYDTISNRLLPVFAKTRLWVLCYRLFSKHLSESYTALFPGLELQPSLYPRLDELLCLQTLNKSLGLDLNQASEIHRTDCLDSSCVSPRTVYFVLFLVSISDLAADAAIRSVSLITEGQKHRSWTPDLVPNTTLLLALTLYLQDTVCPQKPARWNRVVRFLDFMVQSDNLLLPFRFRHLRSSGTFNDRNTCTVLFNWSVIRGAFDIFGLFSDLLYLWLLLRLPQTRTCMWSFRCICHATFPLIRRVNHRVNALLESGDSTSVYFHRIIQLERDNLFNELLMRLELGLSVFPQPISPELSSDLRRLRLAAKPTPTAYATSGAN